VDFQDVRRMMMKKNNEIELNIAQITTIHKTVKGFNPKKNMNVWIKTIVLEWARGAGKSTILVGL
jgi:S-adenosylmethionine synthetase